MRISERGQIVLITAAAMIVLLGVMALVVDLGFSWMLHRQEQNAADPGAIAAARWLKDPATGKPAWNQPAANSDACFYAQQNGFFVSDADCTTALAAGDLKVRTPPIIGPYANQSGMVQVIITATRTNFFGQMLGQPTATVATAAVAANQGGNSNSSSLIALQPTCQMGSSGSVNGGATVNIFPVSSATDGGYVHVNSPCGSSSDDRCSNGVGSSALQISGTLKTPYAYVVGSCTYNGSGANGLVCAIASPCLDEDALPAGDPLSDVPEPVLTDFPNGTCPDGTVLTAASTKGCDLPPNGSGANTYCPRDAATNINVCRLRPGVYYGGWSVGSNVRLELEPGMYILAGNGISLSGTGSSIEAVQSPTGVEARVTIFSTDGPNCASIPKQCEGAVNFTASQAFKAKALNAATCGIVSPTACSWKGILLWQDGTVLKGAKDVTIGGQSSTVLAGTIYAPASTVHVNGGSATTGCTGSTAGCLAIQIISWRWTITGGGTLDMPYDPGELYQLDKRGLVH